MVPFELKPHRLRRATPCDRTRREPALAAGLRVAEGRTTRALAELVPGDVEQPGQQEVPLLQLRPTLLLGRDRRIRRGRGRRGAVQLGERYVSRRSRRPRRGRPHDPACPSRRDGLEVRLEPSAWCCLGPSPQVGSDPSSGQCDPDRGCYDDRFARGIASGRREPSAVSVPLHRRLHSSKGRAARQVLRKGYSLINLPGVTGVGTLQLHSQEAGPGWPGPSADPRKRHAPPQAVAPACCDSRPGSGWPTPHWPR
jgi:hypothetical protein